MPRITIVQNLESNKLTLSYWEYADRDKTLCCDIDAPPEERTYFREGTPRKPHLYSATSLMVVPHGMWPKHPTDKAQGVYPITLLRGGGAQIDNQSGKMWVNTGDNGLCDIEVSFDRPTRSLKFKASIHGMDYLAHELNRYLTESSYEQDGFNWKRSGLPYCFERASRMRDTYAALGKWPDSKYPEDRPDLDWQVTEDGVRTLVIHAPPCYNYASDVAERVERIVISYQLTEDALASPLLAERMRSAASVSIEGITASLTAANLEQVESEVIPIPDDDEATLV